MRTILKLILAFICFLKLHEVTANHYRSTDDLMDHKIPGWLRTYVATHSAKDQLGFIESFKNEYSEYKRLNNFNIPLGEISKGRLREISSMLYNNLVTGRYSQDDFENTVLSAIALHKCDFSNHCLFDALEYCLWTGNAISDLSYVRLFFAMTSCRYSPSFDFHNSLSIIIQKQSDLVASYQDEKTKIEILASTIIAYNMMKGVDYIKVKTECEQRRIDFSYDVAIQKLWVIYKVYYDARWKKDFFELFPSHTEYSMINSTNLYVALLYDLICKIENINTVTGSIISIKNILDEKCFMPSKELKFHQKLMLSMQSYKKGKVYQNRFERQVENMIQPLSNSFCIYRNLWHRDLGCELDFFLINKETGQIIIVECDGYFHFSQNIHGVENRLEFNGLSLMKTGLFAKFSKVLRVSGVSSFNGEYYDLSGVTQKIIDLAQSDRSLSFFGLGYV